MRKNILNSLICFTSFCKTVLLFLIIAIPAYAQSQDVVPDALEYAALKDLYQNTNGGSWTNTTNWPTTWPATATSAEFGTWFGVGVYNGDVTSLQLGFNNLNGSISASLGNLTQLTYVGLNSNNLSGGFPAAALSNAHNLTHLYLDHNQLSGPLPAWSDADFLYMQYFNLSFNQFTGAVPASYTTFAYLDLLDLAYNQLTGFPSAFASMTWLRDLRLSGNPFPSGPMPSWIGLMSGLTTLLMEGNNFTGTIPASLGDLHNLQYLSLNSNQFTGSIPAALAGCTSMGALDLLGNQLDDMSNDLSAMTQLGYLGLSNNRFHGPIPEWFGHLPAMYQLYMNGNQFTSLPSSFSNLTNLAYIYLQDNQLTGSLPDVSRMTNLHTVNVARNKFSGSMPSSFSSRNIYFFDASDNQLSGEFPAISNWTRLVSLTITRNQFSGAFPSTAGLNALTFVEATANRFTSFPTTLLSLPAISYISFQGNQLTTIENFETEVAANHVHPGNLGILFIDQNQLDFKLIGTLGSLGFPLFAFPQNEISDIKKVGFNENSALSIPSRPLQSTTAVIWEKNIGGTWSDVTANTEDATRKTFQRSSALLSDVGTYRWKMTDTQFPDAVINSTGIEVKTNTQLTLDNYAFLYKYDGRKRMTHKKVPGADWVYMVYDNRDRLVMTQDGNQRLNNQWSYTKYDALNRPVMTGVYTHASAADQATMQGAVNTFYTNLTNPEDTGAWYETFSLADDNQQGYDNKSFPRTNVEPLTVTFYDNYDFKNWMGPYYGYLDEAISMTVNGAVYSQPATESVRVLGQVTGTRIKNLSTSSWMNTVSYYDDKYRVIQTVSDNSVYGIDRTTNVVDFVGKVLQTKTTHTDNIVPLNWQNVSGVTINKNSATREVHEGWAWAGASSVEMLPANTDGWVEITAISQPSSQAMIGLSSSGSGGNPFNIDYALFLNGNTLIMYENGSQIPDLSSPFNPGDLLRVVRAGTTIRYYINSTIVYTSSVPSTSALLVDFAIADAGATLKDIRTSFKTKTNTITRKFGYDHAGRLLTTHHSVNDATPVLLAANEYNELGQLVDKNLHSTDGSTFKQSTDYRYNIRGWLTSINNADLTLGTTNDDAAGYGKDLFGMELAYEKPVTDLTTTNDVQFNGNISAITYTNNQALGAIKSNGYKYAYDPMNRLKEAEFRQKKLTWGLSSYIDAGNVTQAAQAFSETGFKYDLNGNISELKRSGAAGSQQMDDLSYVYEGNKLLSVSDGGDVSKGFVDGNVTGDDYHYDVNGNMTADANKNITAISYNHLNLPEKVTKGTGDYIKYVYDATGRKLSQQVYDASNVLKKKSDYAGEYFYENDTLKFINHEEGRIVLIKEGQPIAPEYQYHLKDHLGNVRTTFTTKDETDDSQATYETANVNVEQSKFLNHDQVRYINHPFYDHTKAKGGPSPEGDFSQRLSGNAQEKIGLARSISVMPGDKLNIEVFAKYYQPIPDDPSAFGQLMYNIINSLAVPAGTIIDGAGYALSANNSLPFTDGLTKSGGDPAAPKAYLNWAVFNRDYVQNLDKSGYKRVTANCKEDGTDVNHDWLKPDGEIVIDEPGFIYIWLSNESETPVEVYFDDFKVSHTKSPVVSTSDYYPYGLSFNEYIRENSLLNNYKYNGKELQDELNLGLYDYIARQYDPVLGRFTSVDPAADLMRRHSPYNYAFDNPLRFIDPDGMVPEDQTDPEKKQQQSNGLEDFIGAVVSWLQGMGSTANAVMGNEDADDDENLATGATLVATLITAPLEAEQMVMEAGATSESSVASKVDDVKPLINKVDEVIKPVLSKVEEVGTAAARASTLEPGPYAAESIPARSQARDFTTTERSQINEIGSTTGCHTCGITNPGTKSGNFVPDHQPISALTPAGVLQRLYPHCISCSKSQGGTVGSMVRRSRVPFK